MLKIRKISVNPEVTTELTPLLSAGTVAITALRFRASSPTEARQFSRSEYEDLHKVPWIQKTTTIMILEHPSTGAPLTTPIDANEPPTWLCPLLLYRSWF